MRYGILQEESMTEIVPARIRAQRLSAGKCPTHGAILSVKTPYLEEGNQVGFTYACPEKGCTFDVVARIGSGMHKLLR